jgi:hypothetical protein
MSGAKQNVLGATCLICGAGPFVALGHHTRQKHDVTPREYKRRFPGAPMSHPSFREAWTLAAIDKGWTPGRNKGKRRAVCFAGLHPMRGNNLIVEKL